MKIKTERVIGLGRKTREEIVKWNQMTVLRFQTRGDIRHPRPPSGAHTHHQRERERERENSLSLPLFHYVYVP